MPAPASAPANWPAPCRAGFQAEPLHGDLDQKAREAVLGRFRRGQIGVLVATDVAARGLDIKDISHVINYDLPYDPEYYVHRIGRTGRAGETGIAITLVTPRERWHLSRIEQFTRSPIVQARIPTAAQVIKRRDDQFLDQLADQIKLGDLDRERALVAELSEAGLDPLDLAAAAIQLARAGEQQRPIEHIAEVQPPARRPAPRREKRAQGSPRRSGGRSGGRNGNRKNRREPNMVRLSINAGRSQSLYPGEIVGAIAGTSQIPGKAIGAIDIQGDRAFVDVAAQHADLVLDRMKGWKLRGQAIELQRA